MVVRIQCTVCSADTTSCPQMGRQLHGVLLNHMQRYTYSAMGALRWKRDMTAYCEWVRTLHAPLVDEKFEELQVAVSLPLPILSHVIGMLCYLSTLLLMCVVRNACVTLLPQRNHQPPGVLPLPSYGSVTMVKVQTGPGQRSARRSSDVDAPLLCRPSSTS